MMHKYILPTVDLAVSIAHDALGKPPQRTVIMIERPRGELLDFKEVREDANASSGSVLLDFHRMQGSLRYKDVCG